ATFMVLAVWIIFRNQRNASICEECGNRFHATNDKNAATRCPHCGEPYTARSGSPAQTCEFCCEQIPAKPPVPRICPNCHHRKLQPDAVKKEHAKSIRVLTFVLALVALFGIVNLVMFISPMLISGNFTGLLVVLPPAIILLFFGWKLTVWLIQAKRVS